MLKVQLEPVYDRSKAMSLGSDMSFDLSQFDEATSESLDGSISTVTSMSSVFTASRHNSDSSVSTDSDLYFSFDSLEFNLDRLEENQRNIIVQVDQ